MELKNIVLLILGILYFIFRASGNKEKSAKKPGQRPQQSSEGGGSTPSIEDILRELTGEAPRTTQPPVEHKMNKVKKVKPVVVEQNEHEKYRETVAARQTKRPIKIVEELPKVDLEQTESFEFDLRQAVINDAILNRPYQ